MQGAAQSVESGHMDRQSLLCSAPMPWLCVWAGFTHASLLFIEQMLFVWLPLQGCLQGGSRC